MTSPVVTRFAPSPTGFLHIGGARTALFNWLYAKANGGKMLLRIEDTDRARSTDEAVSAILDGLSWLGLDWDGDPVSQFSRAHRHREAAEQMIAKGTAYRCICTPDELAAKREKAREAGMPTGYDGTCREKNMPADTDNPCVVRLKTPIDGETIVEDRVQGEVRFPNKDLDDLVMLRSDGTPTYMLAVVVDDHDMGVTHIIRGDDHLTNAARQTLIFKALGWDVPVMAHIPLIHSEDGAKLSKRHGAIGAETYRALGYLPAALRNYLVRLGWAHGDDEIMSTAEMIGWFGFDGMNKAASRFDFAKLDALNSHYMREMPDDDLLANLEAVLPELEGGDQLATAITERTRPMLLRAMPALKERAKTLVDLARGAAFIVEKPPLNFEEKASALLDADGLAVISALLPKFETALSWDHDTIAEIIKGHVEQTGLKMGKVAQPVRAALTGKASSPGAFDVLLILGQEESLARLHEVLSPQ